MGWLTPPKLSMASLSPWSQSPSSGSPTKAPNKRLHDGIGGGAWTAGACAPGSCMPRMKLPLLVAAAMCLIYAGLVTQPYVRRAAVGIRERGTQILSVAASRTKSATEAASD